VKTSLPATYKCLQRILYVSCVMFLLDVAFLISKDASGIWFFVQCKMLQCLNSLILPGFWEQWFKYNVVKSKVLFFRLYCFSVLNTSLYTTMMWDASDKLSPRDTAIIFTTHTKKLRDLLFVFITQSSLLL
jgi:hypothetical protein